MFLDIIIHLEAFFGNIIPGDAIIFFFNVLLESGF